MKPKIWMPIAVVGSYIAIMLIYSPHAIDADPLTVSRYIAEIPKSHSVLRSSVRSIEGDVELGGKAEIQIRRLFNSRIREAPIHIMEYKFETGSGDFTVSIHEVRERITDILILGDDLDSETVTTISQALRDLVPNCRFRKIPSRPNK